MSLRQTVRLLRWSWSRNLGPRLDYLLGEKHLNTDRALLADELRKDGIAVRRSVGNPQLFNAVRNEALGLFDAAWDGHGIRPGLESRVKDRGGLGAHEAKDFLVFLIPPKLTADSPFLRYALQEDLLAVAEAYLGMRTQLTSVHLWLNYPTGGEARSTQLWHKDADDVVNLKVFTYLTDVDESSGPFAFIPATHPFGRRRAIEPQAFQPGRVDDRAMEEAVRRTDWRINIGAAGTTVFADTCGYHKGVKPVARPRLMLMCHYTSRSAFSAQELRVTGSLENYQPHQRAAVAAARD
jgi:hypothetical protein